MEVDQSEVVRQAAMIRQPVEAKIDLDLGTQPALPQEQGHGGELFELKIHSTLVHSSPPELEIE